MRLTVILFTGLQLFLIGCRDDPNRNIERLFEKIVEQIPEQSVLEEYRNMSLKEAIHSGDPQIFGDSFTSLEEDAVYRKHLLDYYNKNDLDTMNYFSYCVFRGHFHQFINGQDTNVPELKEFVSEHLYDY